MNITRPRVLLGLEGVALLATSVFFFGRLGGNWLLFAVFLLAPDLAALAYLVNVSVGATCYNLVHNEVIPAALLIFGVVSVQPVAMLAALIWLSHIGIDRAAGFGLKYPTKFQDTHLGRV